MNIEVKAEETEQTKNDHNANPHVIEAKSHENSANLPVADQQGKNFNFFEENLHARKSSKENFHESNMNPQASILNS